MLKILPLAALAFAMTAGAARAGDHHGFRAAGSGPQSIAELMGAGGGTATGTVSKVAATWFTITDGRDRMDVTTKGFLPEGLQPGQQVTVVGGMRQGALRASQIIRDDGTAFGTAFGRGGGREERGDSRKHHDD